MAAFDEKRYLQENPDVAEAVARGEITAEKHWEMYGRKEGRRGAYSVSSPTAFDGSAYLANNPDVAAAVNAGDMTAEEHYVRFGQAEGRKPYYAGTDAKTAPSAGDAGSKAPALSQELQTLVSTYADGPAASGLRAGGLADTLEKSVITPWRDLLRQVKAGTLNEADFNAKSDALVKERTRILGAAPADDFTEAIRYAGTVSPGFLEAVAKGGATALEQRAATGTSAASSLSASEQATKDMMATAEAAANRERVKNRRGRGATLLTGMAGLDQSLASVARRLLTGA